MRHLGKYQCMLGKQADYPDYAVNYRYSEEPRLFSDEQLTEFIEKIDTQITMTPIFPYNDVIYPAIFRQIYCCGLRSSEACNLKVEYVYLIKEHWLSIKAKVSETDCSI